MARLLAKGHLCVVCGEEGREGELRKSGFKCTGCVGRRSKASHRKEWRRREYEESLRRHVERAMDAHGTKQSRARGQTHLAKPQPEVPSSPPPVVQDATFAPLTPLQLPPPAHPEVTPSSALMAGYGYGHLHLRLQKPKPLPPPPPLPPPQRTVTKEQRAEVQPPPPPSPPPPPPPPPPPSQPHRVTFCERLDVRADSERTLVDAATSPLPHSNIYSKRWFADKQVVDEEEEEEEEEEEDVDDVDDVPPPPVPMVRAVPLLPAPKPPTPPEDPVLRHLARELQEMQKSGSNAFSFSFPAFSSARSSVPPSCHLSANPLHFDSPAPRPVEEPQQLGVPAEYCDLPHLPQHERSRRAALRKAFLLGRQQPPRTVPACDASDSQFLSPGLSLVAPV